MSRPIVSLLIAAAATWAIPDPVRAAPALRHQLLVNGDFALFGNTLAHECTPSAPDPDVGTVGACGTDLVNNQDVDVYWQSDPVTSTAVASTAVGPADARSTAVFWMPDGAIVRYARLYWAAEVATPTFDAGVQLVTPGGAAHAIATEEALVIPVVEAEGGPAGLYWYQSSADVTTLLQGFVDARGPYTLSGVDSLVLTNLNYPTAFAGWWMVVFYEDPTDSALRQLTLFDGLDAVVEGAPQNVTLAGFRVPAGFDAKLGVVAYEGDQYNGDSLFFRGYDSAVEADPAVLTTLSDALNAENDFFNGTRSWLGAPATRDGDLPRMSGTTRSMQGLDLDVVDLVANGAIKADDDSAKIRATNGGFGDSYALAAFVTSINTLRPSFLRTTKSAVNLTSGDASTFAGDVIEYVVSTANTGNDPSVGTVLADPLPAGVTFVPGSLRIVSGTNAGAKTDAAGDDQGEYDAAARKVVVRLGAGADGAAGGQMAIGESAEIRFRVTVDAGASGTLLNQVVITAGGLSGEPARTFGSSPPGGGEGGTPLPVDACRDDGDCGGALPACLVSATPNVCVACTGNAHCGGATPICDAAANVCVGLSTLSPSAQEKTTVVGTAAPFTVTLTSNVADTYDADLSGCAWPVELWSGATRLGTWDPVTLWTFAPANDTDADGRPDGGATSGGGATRDYALWITPSTSFPAGSTCTLTLRGAVSGVTASADAVLRTGAAAAWTPDHVGANAKAVSRGGTVRFPGVIRNNTSAPLSFDASALVTTSPDAGPLMPHAVYSDPDGDGDPSDGAPIASTGPVPAFGGTVHVVLAIRATTATGAPLPTGTILSATAFATSGGASAQQASEARVQLAATYSDAARTLVRGRFAPCDTVHLGAALLPGGTPYALEWYAKESPDRAVDAPIRAVDPWPVSGGTGTDSLVVPPAPSGIWTVLVVQKTSPETVLETITFEVERLGALVSLSAPPRLSPGDGLSVSATVRNDNALSTYSGSQLAYQVSDDAGTVYMDGAGDFGAAPATAHLTSAVTVAPGATAADSWALASAAWPAPGVYRVDATWRLQCGATPAIAAATTTVEVIPEPPTIANPGALVSTRTPTISGTGVAGAAVTVSAGTASCGPVVVAGDGTWSCTPTGSLADGEYVATAVQTLAGATSDPSAPRTFTVDATPPAVAIVAPAGGALLGAAAAPGRAVAFSGTAEAGASVAVAAGGRSGASSGPSWTVSLTFDADGAYTAVATATDAAGNAANVEVGFSVDVTPPAPPTIGFPADGSLLDAGDLSGPFLTVAGTADPDAVVTVTMGAETRTATRSGSAWSATFEPGEGTVTVTTIASDRAGNVSAAASSTFTVDVQVPGAATFAFPLDGATLSGADAPGGALTMAGALTGTMEPDTAVSVVVDGAMYAATVSGAAWSLALTLDDGVHAASAVAVDAAGNASAPTTIVFWVDASTPVPVLDPIAPTSVASLTVSGSAESGATVTVWVDAAFAGTTAASGGAFLLDVAVPEGTLTFTASAVDGLGNASALSAPVTVVVDRTAPAAPVIDGPAAGAVVPPGTVVFHGTAEMGATVSVAVNGVAATDVAADGTFSIPVTLPAGDFTATVTAADAVGNVSPAATRSFQASQGSPTAGGEPGGGGCGCSGAGGASPGALLLLPLLAALAPRRRRPAA